METSIEFQLDEIFSQLAFATEFFNKAKAAHAAETEIDSQSRDLRIAIVLLYLLRAQIYKNNQTIDFNSTPFLFIFDDSSPHNSSGQECSSEQVKPAQLGKFRTPDLQLNFFSPLGPTLTPTLGSKKHLYLGLYFIRLFCGTHCM